MRVESVLNEAEDLDWKGYAESRTQATNAAGPQAQTGAAAVGPGPGVTPQTEKSGSPTAQNVAAGVAGVGPGSGITPRAEKSNPPAAQNTGIAAVGPGPGAQNTGIAAVGPGPGFSPQGAENVDQLPVPPLASVNDLIGSTGSE